MSDKQENDVPRDAPREAARGETGAGAEGGRGDRSPPPSPPPPRGPRLGIVLLALVVLGAGYGVGRLWGDRIAALASRIAGSITGNDAEVGESTGGEPSYYTCGMHPWVILPRPGTCPVCQMDLTPLDPAKFTGDVTIDPRVVQTIGVRVAEVVTGPLVKTIRTVGSVDYDERRVRDVNIKVKGWIEKLHVDYLGAEVVQGQPLFDLYSPELYDTQQQYLLALKSQDGPEIPFLSGARPDRSRLLESSRIRLEFYDIRPDQIEELEKRGQPQKTLTIVSPHEGVVISKHANEGMLVDPGMLVFRIADLSKVWVLVTLYEYQLPYVSEGQQAVMSLPYIPGQTFEGRVVYIYPYLEKTTREVQLRLEFENPDLVLKPGMFANVELRSTLAAERTLAPRSAIIDTGEREVAFVSLGEGRFEPRTVRTGVLTENGMVEILDGLRPGELAVTSAQFLLDSEAKIREALAKMITGDLASEQEASATVVGASELTRLPAGAASALREVLRGYFTIGEKLADDSVSGIETPARHVATAMDRLLALELEEDPHFWHRHTEAATVRGKAIELAGVENLETARLDYSDLSVALAKLVRATGVPPAYSGEVQELHCPMYREGQGGSSWLQPEGAVRNPFFGSTMLRCFDRRAVLPVTGGSRGVDTEKADANTDTDTELDTDTQADTGKGSDTSTGTDTAAVADPEPVKEAATGDAMGAGLAAVLRSYLAVGDRLAGDSLQGVAESAEGMASSLRALAGDLVAGDDSGKIAEAATRAREASEALAKATELESAREEYARLSRAIGTIFHVAGIPEDREGPIDEIHCPMYRREQGGATWLQAPGEVRNPFYGSRMLRCFDTRTRLPARDEAGPSHGAGSDPAPGPNPGPEAPANVGEERGQP